MKQDFRLLELLEEVSEKEADKLKYLYSEHLIGHCRYIFGMCIPIERRVNPIPEEWFDAVLDGIINSFFGGCEPEWQSEESAQRYEDNVKKLKNCEWIIPTKHIDIWGKEYYKPKSPYKDPTIPFLHPKEEKKS